MKYMFLIALFSNIVFFLWEINTGALNSPLVNHSSHSAVEKKILLTSELPEKTVVITLADNKSDQFQWFETHLDVVGDLSVLEEEYFQGINEPIVVLDKETVDIADSSVNGDVILDDFLEEKTDPENVKDKIEVDVIKDKKENKVIISQDKVIEKALVIAPAIKNKELCYRVGPFKTNKELEDWQEENKFDISTVESFNEEYKVISGYLVYYPAASHFSESKRNVKKIKKKGISDLWLFRKGELKGIISLGLFIEESRALILQRKLLKKGLNVELMKRYKTENSIFAKVFTSDKDKLKATENLVILSCLVVP